MAAVVVVVVVVVVAAGGGECSGGDGVRGGTYLVNLVPRVGKYIWTVKLAPGSPAVLAGGAASARDIEARERTGGQPHRHDGCPCRRSGTRVIHT